MKLTGQNHSDKWLLCCLSWEKSIEDIATLKRLSDSDWDAIIQRSIHHGIAPYLYQQLTNLETDLPINPAILNKLHQIYMVSFTRNTRLYHHLFEILTRLQNRHIPIIVLKGVYLAEVIYKDIALRSMDDIDLLTRQSDLAETAEILQSMGYSPARHFWVDVEKNTYDGLPAFSKAQAPVVELHWNIEAPTSPFTIDLDTLWQRAKPAAIAGVDAFTLSPEDHLLHLCLHTAYHHQFDNGLKPFCDILEIVAQFQNEINWPQIQTRAKSWKAGKAVYLTLYFAQQLLTVPIPEEILTNLKPLDLDLGLMMWSKNQILTKPNRVQSLFNLAEVWRARRLNDKLVILLKRLFPSPNVMATMYAAHPSSKKIYLYYPVRLKDLLQRYIPTIWHLLHSNPEAITAIEQEVQENSLQQWLTSD